MAIKVNFYRFTKKENSTARPSGSGTELDCTLKDSSSIFFPVIKLNLGAASAPSFNYCIIPNFNRWYYITNWEWDRGLWYASLQVDVLATYKPEIGNSSLYALRASGSWDGRIVDNLYPAKVGTSTTITEKWDHFPVPGRTCILGVVSKTARFGSVDYYAISAANLHTVISELLDDTIADGVNGFNAADASIALQKSLIDPLQYIKSAVLLPFAIGDIANKDPNPSQINIFNWTLTAQGYRCGYQRAPINYIYHSFAIPKHPQTSARGNFLNQAPYTTLSLYIPPFGVIDLDTTVFANKTTVDIKIAIDQPTGNGILEISAGDVVVQRLEAMVGIAVQITQVTRDYLGAATAGLNAIGGLIGGNVSSLANGIGSAIESVIPKSQTIGSAGCYADTAGDSYLQAQFFEIVDDDINHNGRPLCQMVTPTSGYYLIQDGDIPIDGTKEEAVELKRYLEGGFYYE